MSSSHTSNLGQPFLPRHLAIVAARDVTDEIATPDQVSMMASTAARGVRKPPGAGAETMGELAAAVIEAPAPLVARALIAMLRRDVAFAVCTLVAEIEKERLLEEGVAASGNAQPIAVVTSDITVPDDHTVASDTNDATEAPAPDDDAPDDEDALDPPEATPTGGRSRTRKAAAG